MPLFMIEVVWIFGIEFGDCTGIGPFLGFFIFSVEMGRKSDKSFVIGCFIVVFLVYRGWFLVVGFSTAVGRWGMSCIRLVYTKKELIHF